MNAEAPGRAGYRAYRPRLAPRVLVSDALLHGPRTVHLLKNPDTGSSFEVGPKEHFLITRMDGTSTLEELGTQYARTYGRRLGEEHWRRLLGLLGSRGLLDGESAAPTPAPAPTPEPPPGTAGHPAGEPHGSGSPASERKGASQPAVGGPSGERRAANGLLGGSMPLVADADATAERLHRVLGFALSARWMVPLLLLVAAMETTVVLRLGEAVRGAWQLFGHPVLLLAAATLLWLSTALHELAHGVAARRYGGRVAEIGLRWRLPVVMMYCTVANYPYLPSRRARIVTAVAGAVMNLLFLLPFWAIWLLAPLDATGSGALAGLLFLGTVQALAMLVPLPPLDGYKIVSQLLGATDLAASSRRYLRLALRRSPAADRYPRRARIGYTVYGLGSVLVLGVLAAGVVLLVRYLVTTV